MSSPVFVNAETDGKTAEPVAIAHAVTVILSAIVAYGWVAIPDPTINAVGSVLAFVLSAVGAFIARSKVTPTAKTVVVVEDMIRQKVRDELTALGFPQV